MRQESASKRRRPHVLVVMLFAVMLSPVQVQVQSHQSTGFYREQKEVVARNGIVAAADYRAAEAGLEVLKRGGNAVDAAVATAFLMGVYKPAMNGIGGHGGHFGIYWKKTDEYLAIDASAPAPAKSRADMFEVVSQPSGHPGDIAQVGVKDHVNETGYLAMAVPTTVAGYWYLMQQYGTLPWREVVQPAIRVAEQGFIADEIYVRHVTDAASLLSRFPASAATYLPGGRPPNVRDRVVFKDLAATLRTIAEGGYDAFYKGPIADRIVEHIQANGGILSKEDFLKYEVQTFPLTATQYRGHTVLTYPQGSNGSIVAEVLNVLGAFDVRGMGHDSVPFLHTFVEALKLSFTDRFVYSGDRDFTPIPYDGLMSWTYGRQRAKLVRMDKAQIFPPGDPWNYEANGRKIFGVTRATPQSSADYRSPAQEDTTFICVADKYGNVVLITSSLASSFGSKVTVPGLGMTLNNSLHLADPRPGRPLSIAPFKRMLRNSGVCIVAKDGQPILAVSAPGGRNIISATLRVLTNIIDFDMGVQAAIDAPRIHAEANLYDVKLESRIPQHVRDKLSEMGHQIVVAEPFSDDFALVQAIVLNRQSGMMFGGSDPRTVGGARGY